MKFFSRLMLVAGMALFGFACEQHPVAHIEALEAHENHGEAHGHDEHGHEKHGHAEEAHSHGESDASKKTEHHEAPKYISE